MSYRFDKAKAQLLSNEKVMENERIVKKKCGKHLPEEYIKIPKIGEWSLSQAKQTPESIIEKSEKKKNTNIVPNKNYKPFPSTVPLTQEQKDRLQHAPIENTTQKTSNVRKAPYKLKAPRSVDLFIPNNQPKVNYPPGTTSTDLNCIIKSKFRAQNRPLPPLPENDTKLDKNILPLEVFDDTSYAEYSIEELLKHPEAVSRFNDKDQILSWKKCTVIGYDEKTELFTIKWKDNEKEKKVPRFNIRFEIEKEDLFNKRLEQAKESCHRYELQFRLDNRIQQMPTDELPDIDFEAVLEPENLKPANHHLPDDPRFEKLKEQLLLEADSNSKYLNNKLEFFYELEHNPMIPNRDEFMTLIPPPPTVPQYGLFVHFNYDFQKLSNTIGDKLLMANPNILTGIISIYKIFQESKSLTFLTNGYPDEILPLEEFVNREKNKLSETTNFFKTTIQETLESVLGATMVNEEDFNPGQNTKEKFQNLVLLLMRMLHTVLLTIVDNTLIQFLGCYEKYKITNKWLFSQPQFECKLIYSEEHLLDLEPTLSEFKEKSIELLTLLGNSISSLPEIELPILDLEPAKISFDECQTSVQNSKTKLDETITNLFLIVRQFLDAYRHIQPVLGLDPNIYAEEFDKNGTKTLDEYRFELKKFNDVLEVVQNSIGVRYRLGLLLIECDEFKNDNITKMKTLIENMLLRMKGFAISELTELNEEFEKIFTKLKKVPETPEELSELKSFIESINQTTESRSEKMRITCQRFSFLDEYKFEISNEECSFKYQLLSMPNFLVKQIEKADQMIQVERVRMIRELRNKQKKLETALLDVSSQVETFFSKFQDIEMAVDAAEKVNEMQQKIQELKEKQEKYCSHERLFDFEPQPSKTMAKVVENFMPLHILWNLANDWLYMSTNWYDTPFPQIKPDAMSTFMAQAVKKITKLKKDLQRHPRIIDKVLIPLNEQIEKFKTNLPLISKLRHPGIKTKHWEKISKIVGFSVIPSMELTLQGFLDLNLGRWNEQITEIANVAAQEYNIESSLDQMDAELQTQQFLTTEFRDTGQYILSQVNDIISIIDDQLVTTQTLLTSPFVAPVKKRAIKKLDFLKRCHDTLDAWVECQRGWLYLQPIFTGTSIQQKLHREAMEWQRVDKMWTNLMVLTHSHPSFETVMHRDTLYEDLADSNKLLEIITQGLNAYLESKRLGFPRFFFLSNDELISILSHTKDFNIIQKSMNKLFEYVQSIDVDSQSMITSMNDDGLEKVEFISPVDGNAAEIEDWLNAFEEEMKITLKEKIGQSLAASTKRKREQWITEFPAQVILISNQIIWTQQVTTSLMKQKGSLSLLQQKFVEQLESLTAQIRQPLSPSNRQVISCLLINEVHNRDIINNLAELEVDDVDDFKWQVQLRYYWEEGTVIVKNINNNYEYSYEYAGNSSRLVITPLTDRCYQTLLSAFKQNLSGAPSGPAGTGKTETVRDCAKALGRSCVVYNCSEEVTPEQMSQFFAGLSSSGSWSCFDEFNRINIEVLSVIAQQVRSIQTAIASNVETFQLDQRTLKLNSNAAICITMNPGYAGRTELPDNLKTLFRPCAMMVPDFGFIAEIMLFSGGFATASVLSKKLVAIFDLCRKQLSNAYHYDWGLRAMKAILTTAGKAKRSNLNEKESFLLVQTIKDCTRPRLVSVDIPLFDGIVHDVFPDVSCQKNLSENLEKKLIEAYKELKMQPLEHYLLKCNEIFETTIVRHGIMFVGGAMGGKSVAWKALQIALTNLAAEGEGMGVHVDSLNPKAISIPELYGLFDPVTSGWSDGVLSSHIRDCSASDPTEYKWILVDGPVDSLWIETMNSLLDDNKVLCLSNNERISLGNHCKMMFEVDDLSQASPATVSRCGMIYFDQSTLPWNAICDSWKDSHIQEIPILTEKLRTLMDVYIPSMLQFVECDAKPAIGSNPLFIVKNLMKLIDAFLDVMRKPVLKPASDGEDAKSVDPLNHSLYFSMFSNSSHRLHFGYFNENEDSCISLFEKIFFFCLVWSFGAVLTDDSRQLFDDFIKDLFDKNDSKIDFPKEESVFDFFVDLSKNDWCEWCDGITGVDLTSNKPIEQILIPTTESSSAIFLARLMIHHSQHFLLHGPESCKTLVVKTLMNSVLDKSFDCKNLPLANCSVASNILKVLRSFMHKSHGVFGPLNNQQLVVFLDNIGSVKPEIYGAQPPLELIRQFFDYGGWYNTSNVEFQRIVGTTLIAGMGPEGAGLFSIPERLVRHFYYIHIPKYKSDSMSMIVGQLFHLTFAKFPDFVKEQISSMISISLEIFEDCTKNLLPIPSKLHYIFSLRNIVRVLKGMMLVEPKEIKSGDNFVHLWANEISREFYDRFNSDEDRKWFSNQLERSCETYFHKKIERQNLFFNSFSDRNSGYKEVNISSEDLLKISQDLLEEHNREAQKPLDIVLFNEAVDHLSALSRTLSMKRGHALLVGVKSSGRKSLARLSLYMNQMDLFEIKITRTYNLSEWREDMKNLMKQCGQNDLPTGFVISDVQIVGNYQLEDISNLLINGEIPNLFENDEKEQIKADIAQAEMITTTSDGDPWLIFQDRIKRHLHIILVFSPFGTAFKESMLTFPALRTETTIDWYMPWSKDALDSVAKSFLKKADLGIDEKKVNSVVNVCVKVHKSVEDISTRFMTETKRFTACTPSRYFELIASFCKRLKIQQQKNEELFTKYSGGVEKIVATRAQVEELSHKLDRDIPMLQAKRNEVEEMLKELTVKQKEVEKTKSEVQAQSEVAKKEADEAAETNRDAQEKLAAAQPILQAAQEAVDSMDKNALVNIKQLKVIHPALRSTFDAICIIFGRQPRKVDTGVPGVKEDDYWPETLSLVNDIQFIKKVKNYKVEEISKATIDKLKKYVGANKQERDQKLAAVQGGYQAVAQLYQWVCAAFDYWHVYQEILPKKIAAEQASAKLAKSEKVLAESMAHLKSVEEQLESLQNKFNDEKKHEQELQENVAITQLRLSRAQKIMSGLSGETKRWSKSADDLKEAAQYLLGDSLLQVSCLTHLGAFSQSFRLALIDKWKRILREEGILFTRTFNISQSLGNDPTIREWIVKGLPNDTHSIDNALIIANSDNSFPLLIDPQLSGTKWLRSEIGEKIVVLRFDQSDFLQRMKSCVSFGLPVLIENVGLKLDPLIDPILSRETLIVDGQKKITLGGEYVQYDDKFRLYLSTKYPNPIYSPEVCSQVSLINFTTTQEGLSDLLMNNLIEVERDDLDKKRIMIMEANASNTKKLKEIEDEILQIVSNAGSDILDDNVAIDTLQRAQKTSASIEQQMAQSEKTEKQIASFREKFSNVSDRAALLYFCASDFSVVDPMYQFSLKWFVNIFKNAIHQSEHPTDQTQLINAFHTSIARQFFQSVSFSLFSRHKLLFSTLMTIRILLEERKITSSELAFILSPNPTKLPNEFNSFISDDIWSLLSSLPSVSPCFKDLLESLKTNEEEWKTYFSSNTPENDEIPFKTELSPFEKLLLLRVCHLHRVREGLRVFVSETLGKEFVEPPALNLGKVFNESSPLSPLIFIITPGIDPLDEVVGVAHSMDLSKYLKVYSLGRGRGQGAEELIENAVETGMWVFLQNCHLSLSWMPKLEYIIDNLKSDSVNPRFRLCLVTMSTPEFPIGILYQGTKLIYEIPKGIRENMLRMYSGINSDEYDTQTSEIEKRLTFHLSFFHAVVLERVQFGPIGWNIPYEFNPSDFAISRKHLRGFLSENINENGSIGVSSLDQIPFEALTYVIGELNYGGRVTDRWDRRLLLSLLKRFFSRDVLDSNFSFGINYESPQSFDMPLQNVDEMLTKWPVVTEGVDVGLSQNASTITARNEALSIFNSLVEIQPTLVAESGSISHDQFALNFVESLISDLPEDFEIHSFEKQFDLTDTINTVLHHEVLLYNRLLSVIRSSLQLLIKGLKGLIVIDQRLEILSRRLLANKVPEIWLESSFPSILSLRSYMQDLKMRVKFLNDWVKTTNRPIFFKLGSFFHPEEFLTAVLQVYARKHSIPFDALRWITVVLDKDEIDKLSKEKVAPEDGIYIEGPFIEGAKWDVSGNKLVECKQTELISTLPLMHLIPAQNSEVYDMNVTFECPLYRTQNRGSGALGLPNYIMSLFIPSENEPPDHWIQRSVATFITVQS